MLATLYAIRFVAQDAAGRSVPNRVGKETCHGPDRFNLGGRDVEQWRFGFRNVKDLVQRIDADVKDHNPHSSPFRWTATADSIVAKEGNDRNHGLLRCPIDSALPVAYAEPRTADFGSDLFFSRRRP